MTEMGRIYRKVPYGPLLDIFLLDMRSYRGPNTDRLQEIAGPEGVILGSAQLAWLKHELRSSKATWKVIAADLPIGLVSDDAIAHADGPPRGREHEIANLLSFIKHSGVRNTVWITADMHYTAAHYYDPNRAVFDDADRLGRIFLRRGGCGWNESVQRQQLSCSNGPCHRVAPPPAARCRASVSFRARNLDNLFVEFDLGEEEALEFLAAKMLARRAGRFKPRHDLRVG